MVQCKQGFRDPSTGDTRCESLHRRHTHHRLHQQGTSAEPEGDVTEATGGMQVCTSIVRNVTAFQVAKDSLQANTLLVHFDPDKLLILAADTSDYGIRAVLSHVMKNGKERPIAYTSLNAAEKQYSQLHKEALAIISGIKKFHNYIYGRHFVIQPDHKPLAYIPVQRTERHPANGLGSHPEKTLSNTSYSNKKFN